MQLTKVWERTPSGLKDIMIGCGAFVALSFTVPLILRSVPERDAIYISDVNVGDVVYIDCPDGNGYCFRSKTGPPVNYELERNEYTGKLKLREYK